MLVYLDFSTASEESCIEFAERVKIGKIHLTTIYHTIQYLRKRVKYNEKKAINTIKNLVLTSCYVPFERTDYQALCGEMAIYISRFINIKGGANFKVFYAVYRSQVEKDENSLKSTARIELISDLIHTFDNFTDNDKKIYSRYEETFHKLIENDSRFNYCYKYCYKE